MKRYRYTSNAWGYVHSDCRDNAELATRLIRCGFDGYDLFVGHESQPMLPVDAPEETYLRIRRAAEEVGGSIASVVLVGFDLADEQRCRRELIAAPRLAHLLGTDVVHLLPRKSGISQTEGFMRLKRLWQQAGRAMLDAGLTVTAENHAIAPSADEDLFLIRVAADFDRLLNDTAGEIKLKYDCSWFWWADEDPLPAIDRLLPQVACLDLKDSRKGSFVTPGTGRVDFSYLASLLARTQIEVLPVEIEHHHFEQPSMTQADSIDALNSTWLGWYRAIFEASVRR